MQAVAELHQIPLATLNKKTARWKREEQAKLEQLQGALATRKGPKPGFRQAKAQEAIGRQTEGRINASGPSPLPFTDEYRIARKLGRDAMSIAMEGLIHEATHGTGASRVSAIRELLDRAGLAKDKERKDEPSPYEDESQEMLAERVVELLGSNKMLASLLKATLDSQRDPTTSGTGLDNRPITPSPSPSPKNEGSKTEALDAVDAGVGDVGGSDRSQSEALDEVAIQPGPKVVLK